ncbi:GerAB/ArcD/ProY family transporter [Paenibacillus barengoltzii]|uniref:GerAB/ArcD/ProY family transporter n=1 Tax=Paenibacillus barengoltzii TaxID=343517 RepID=UPI002FD8F3F0
MSQNVKPSSQVSAYFTWFLVHGVQTGIGMLNFQQKITRGAQQDAWVSLLGVGVLMHFVIFMLFRLMRMAEDGDIFSLHRQLFGNLMGKALSLLLFFYCVLICVGQIRPYVEVIHVWVFPDSALWQIALIILAAAAYIVSGGFRVVTGICLLCVFIPSLILPTLYFPMNLAHWNNLLPIMNHDLGDYITSAMNSLYIFLGPEFLLFYYPFLKDKRKAHKWAHLATAYTTALYLLVLFTTLGYFNMMQLERTIWPTLVLSKIIRLAFLERFDYIYIFNWLLVIFPICSISIWAAVRILHHTLKLPRKWALWITLIVVMGVIISMRTPVSIERMELLISHIGGFLTFGYLPLLFLIALVRQAVIRIRTARSS